MAKHTPGPWKASDGTITYTQWNIQTVDMSHKNTYIGEIGGGLQNKTEIEANAKLIAAAPDMLRALDLAKEIMTTYNLMKSMPGYAIEQAIKKATL